MYKKLLAIIISLSLAGSALAYSNLWDYYTSNYKYFPQIEDRQPTAKSCEIDNYVGTAEQNKQFLQCLEEEDFTRPAMEDGGIKLGASTALPSTVAFFETSLQASVGSSDTSMTLISNTDKAGTALASSTYAFVIDEGTASEEMVIGDCFVAAAKTCANMSRGLSVVTGTSTVSALQKSHRRGASVKITDGPILIILQKMLGGSQNIPNVLNYNSALTIATSSNQIPTALWVGGFASVASTSVFNVLTNSANTYVAANTFSATNTFSNGLTVGYSIDAGSDNLDVANKSYVDGVAVAGASNANTTTKGIVEEATLAEINAGTAAGGTAARLFINPSTFITSNLATNPVFYVSTSTSDGIYLASQSIAVTAGEEIFVSGKFGGITDNDSSLRIKQSTYAASTTLDGSGMSTPGGGYGTVHLQAYWIATTTENVIFDIVPGSAAGNAGGMSSLIVQHYNQ